MSHTMMISVVIGVEDTNYIHSDLQIRMFRPIHYFKKQRVRIPARADAKVASGLSSGFRKVLKFPPPFTTG